MFQVCGRGKKGGEPKFFQNLRGEPKPYTSDDTVVCKRKRSVLQTKYRPIFPKIKTKYRPIFSIFSKNTDH